MMNEKYTHLIVLGIFLILAAFLVFFRVSVSVQPELVSIKVPALISMMERGDSDQDIIARIEDNPELLSEKYEADFPFSYATPLLYAIITDRMVLAQKMVDLGASIEEAERKLLDEKESNGRYADLSDEDLKKLEQLRPRNSEAKKPVE